MNPHESYMRFIRETGDGWLAFRRGAITLMQWEALRAPLWATHEERKRAYILRIATQQNETIGA